MGFLYKMSKYGMNMYEIREVMAVFGFVQNLGFCAQSWDKLALSKFCNLSFTSIKLLMPNLTQQKIETSS